MGSNTTVIVVLLSEPRRNGLKPSRSIENYTINSDGTIDVDGDVYIGFKYFSNRIPFKFGRVTGNFRCEFNKLKSLKGSPYYVGGDFNCFGNELKNLEGSPEEVVGNFICSNNKLTSLEGMPLEIGGDFRCRFNRLIKLNSMSNIEGTIYCDDIDVSKFRGYCEKIQLPIKITPMVFDIVPHLDSTNVIRVPGKLVFFKQRFNEYNKENI
jgi:hypothetical protein